VGLGHEEFAMAEECATKAAVQVAEGTSVRSAASSGVWRSLQQPRRECSVSDSGPTRGVQHQVSGVSETSRTPLVESLVRSLRVRLGEDLDFVLIAAEVEAELSRYANARVTQFIPVLVESRVWQRLRRHVRA